MYTAIFYKDDQSVLLTEQTELKLPIVLEKITDILHDLHRKIGVVMVKLFFKGDLILHHTINDLILTLNMETIKKHESLNQYVSSLLQSEDENGITWFFVHTQLIFTVTDYSKLKL